MCGCGAAPSRRRPRSDDRTPCTARDHGEGARMPARARSAGIGTRSATGTSRGRCDTPPRRPSVPGTPPVFAGRSAAPSSATLHRGPFGVNRISTTLTYGSTGPPQRVGQVPRSGPAADPPRQQAGRLLEQNASALDRLGGQRAQEAREQAVHQLKIRGQGR